MPRFAWLLAVLMTFALAAPASARTLDPEGSCTAGDAAAIAQAYYPIGVGGEESWAYDPGDSLKLCGFHTFFQPSEGICFDEVDAFTGHSAWSFVSSSPIDRTDVQWLEKITATFSLGGPADVEWKAFATPLMGLRTFQGDEERHTVWRNFGVIFTRAVPGSYILETQTSLPDFGVVQHDVVSFTVLPHEIAQDLGRPGHLLGGSRICP
jgi:hypothetical protein